MNKVAYFSVVYPEARSYLDAFFRSIKDQNFSQFDVILVNDGVVDLDKFCEKYKSLDIQILEAQGSPKENRHKGLMKVNERGYEKIVLADCDDYDAPNRVRVTTALLDEYDIVVNDLHLVNGDSNILKEAYFSARLHDLAQITADFIEDKNIFGFGNSAIRSECLGEAEFDSNVISVDWLFFSSLLIKGKRAVFTDQTATYHRLYDSNMIGLGQINRDALIKALKSKVLHYEYMAKHYEKYKPILREYRAIEKLMKSDEGMNDYIATMKKLRKDNLFWLEEIQPDYAKKL